MAKSWKVLRMFEARKPKDFGVYRAADVAGLKSPIGPDEAPCMLANCTFDEARRYARALESGVELTTVRERRQYIKNAMYSGMN